MELAPDLQATPAVPEDAELTKLYQEYLQKSCEVGQIDGHIDDCSAQLKELEKKLDTTKKQRDKAKRDHQALQQKKFQKLKPVSEPKLELKEDNH